MVSFTVVYSCVQQTFQEVCARHHSSFLEPSKAGARLYLLCMGCLGEGHFACGFSVVNCPAQRRPPAQRWHFGLVPHHILPTVNVSLSVNSSFCPCHPLPHYDGLLEVVAAAEDAFPRSQWGSCFISSFIPGKDSDFSTNEAEDINRKRKIRTSFTNACQRCLVTLSTFPQSPAEFSPHIFIVHLFLLLKLIY